MFKSLFTEDLPIFALAHKYDTIDVLDTQEPMVFDF